MEKNAKILIEIIFCLIIAAIIVFVFVFSDLNSNNNSEFSFNLGLSDNSSSNEEIIPIEESTSILAEYLSKEEEGIYTNYTDKIDLNNMKTENSKVKISDNEIKIVSAGTYYFSGTNEDANIVVDADKNADIILVFDNANITSTKTAVINGIKANSITINAVESSVNTFIDSNEYTEFTDDDEPDSTIFSKTDLIINGSGKFIINSNYKDGIASKDTLKIVNTNIEIISNDDGIRGKDFVAIKNSNIYIKSNGDGIKSTNTDENLGYIIIESGKINIESQRDAIQAESILNISEADISIKTTGDTSQKNSDGDYITSKGLKAGTEITINSGNITINSTDDTIHSNGYIIINDGTITLTSGDDGIHADNNIIINGGTINITKSYEGIESSYIKINGGNIDLIASDDGINIAGGNDNSSFGRPGENTFSSADNGRKLLINGGRINVKSNGDGLDSNGSIYITGGNIMIAGAVNGGNGALDYDSKCVITGGNLIYYGANGMWQNPTADSTQYTIAFSASGNSGDKIELKDSNENTVINFTANMNYGMIGISNPYLKEGETYTLYINDQSKGSLKTTSIVTSNGSSFDRGQMMNGGPGGEPRKQFK